MTKGKREVLIITFSFIFLVLGNLVKNINITNILFMLIMIFFTSDCCIEVRK